MLWTYDFEFVEDGSTIDPISVGIISETGTAYYAVFKEAKLERADPWLWDNVFPHLPLVDREKFATSVGQPIESRPRPMLNWSLPVVKPKKQIAAEVLDLLRPQRRWPELWAWYGAYDHVALCQLWGAMVNLPRGMPMFTRELRQEWDRQAKPPLPSQDSALKHHALWDARYDMTVACLLGLADGGVCSICGYWLANEAESDEHYLGHQWAEHGSGQEVS